MDIKKDEIKGIIFEVIAVTFYVVLTFIIAYLFEVR